MIAELYSGETVARGRVVSAYSALSGGVPAVHRAVGITPYIGSELRDLTVVVVFSCLLQMIWLLHGINRFLLC